MENITTRRQADGWHIVKTVDGVEKKTKHGRATRARALEDYRELEDRFATLGSIQGRIGK